jgi:hypothetical protein
MESLVIFTSITRNYLAKARVLAQSVKKLHPEYSFHCVIADYLTMDDPIYQIEEFDAVIDLSEFTNTLDSTWLFMHALVETCTTVKPLYLNQCLTSGIDKVIYLDPDTRVFSPLTPIVEVLSDYAICLTPHIANADFDRGSIRDNELSAARHGVYNLGFFAVSHCKEGLEFAHWWSDRVVNYGYSQTFMGCFTDQKICDFVPAYFDNVKIWRHPGLNVAHWNLSQREISCVDGQFKVNDELLIFYHFSSYDSGVGEIMSMKYSAQTRTSVDAIWAIYKQELANFSQFEYEKLPWTLATFTDGSPISNEMRLYYRQHEYLHYYFDEPFNTQGTSFKSFWLENNDCRQFEIQWHETQTFLNRFRFARTDDFLTDKLSAVKRLTLSSQSRLFIYGANNYGEEVFNLTKLLKNIDIILLDQNTNCKFGTMCAQSPTDFIYTDNDIVVVCGLAHSSAMRSTINKLSVGSPTIL